MHQDGLLVGVDVELDDVAVLIAVQQLITWMMRQKTGRKKLDIGKKLRKLQTY